MSLISQRSQLSRKRNLSPELNEVSTLSQEFNSVSQTVPDVTQVEVDIRKAIAETHKQMQCYLKVLFLHTEREGEELFLTDDIMDAFRDLQSQNLRNDHETTILPQPSHESPVTDATDQFMLTSLNNLLNNAQFSCAVFADSLSAVPHAFVIEESDDEIGDEIDDDSVNSERDCDEQILTESQEYESQESSIDSCERDTSYMALDFISCLTLLSTFKHDRKDFEDIVRTSVKLLSILSTEGRISFESCKRAVTVESLARVFSWPVHTEIPKYFIMFLHNVYAQRFAKDLWFYCGRDGTYFSLLFGVTQTCTNICENLDKQKLNHIDYSTLTAIIMLLNSMITEEDPNDIHRCTIGRLDNSSCWKRITYALLQLISKMMSEEDSLHDSMYCLAFFLIKRLAHGFLDEHEKGALSVYFKHFAHCYPENTIFTRLN